MNSMDVDYVSGEVDPYQYDTKVTKYAYDRAKHETVMLYVWDKDPNNCCVLDSLKLYCQVDIPDEKTVDNGFGKKLMSKMSIFLDSQLVNESKSR